LPIINKLKHPTKGGIQGTKWKNPPPRKQKKSPKRANHKGNINQVPEHPPVERSK
jgi:hypothetical protein